MGAMQAPASLVWVGPGNVGRVGLLRLREWGVPIDLMGVARRSIMTVQDDNLLSIWGKLLVPGPTSIDTNLDSLVGRLAERRGVRILVDTSTSGGLGGLYNSAFEQGIHVVTAVKRNVVTTYDEFAALRSAARTNGVHFRFRTCIGAGAGFGEMIEAQMAAGDPPIEIGGVLGGTPSFILNTFMDSRASFSDVVTSAIRLGYTDPPDPRLDLSGQDAVNKLLLLMWLCGIGADRESISCTPVMDLPTAEMSADAVMAAIRTQDAQLAMQREKALAAGLRLRYPFRIDVRSGTAQVSLVAVGAEDPSYNLQGSENLVWMRSRAHSTPRVQIGSGAGPEWTAVGVQMDIARILGLL